MYTFHFYAPIEYSHQNTSWTGMGDGGNYPDSSLIETLPHTKWCNAIFGNPTLPKGDSEWQLYEGVPFKIKDPKIILGKPAFASSRNNGMAYFDDFIIREFDEHGAFVRNVVEVDPETDSGWWFWSKDSQGNKQASKGAHKGEGCVSISGTTSEANCSNNKYRFLVKQGYSYSISGWMKGEGISNSSNSQMRIDFESIDSGENMAFRNKKYLEHELLKYLVWTKRNHVPAYVGEFGLHKDCFENNKGGINWVRDVLDLFDALDLNYTYHAYHEDHFGIYFGNHDLPSSNNCRKELIQLFTNHLKGKK
jgi:endoglucanase